MLLQSPLFLSLVGTVVVGYFAAVALVVKKARSAPLGYEDEAGFHFGEEPEALSAPSAQFAGNERSTAAMDFCRARLVSAPPTRRSVSRR